MTWVKIDDKFWRHPKVRKAWRRHPASVGLYVMALAYCNEEINDGFVDDEWLDLQFALSEDEREPAIETLLAVGLWERFSDGYQIHDYLEFQPSRRKIEEVREARRLAGSLGGKRSRGGGRPRRNEQP